MVFHLTMLCSPNNRIIDLCIQLIISLGTVIGMQHYQLMHAIQVDYTDSCILLTTFSRTYESTTIYNIFAASPSVFNSAVITAVFEMKLPIISTMMKLTCTYHSANY